MPCHSADVLNESQRLFFSMTRKNQQKTNSFHPTHFPNKKWNGFGQDFSTYWYRFVNKGETKEENGETLIRGENGQTYFFFKFYFDMKLIVFCTIFFRNFCFIGFLYTELLILTRNALMSEPKPCNWTTLDYPSDPCALFRLTALTFAQEKCIFQQQCSDYNLLLRLFEPNLRSDLHYSVRFRSRVLLP